MKYLFISLIAFAAFSIASCKKCYDCVTTETVTYEDEDLNEIAGSSSTTTIEICGKKDDITLYEANNNQSFTYNDFLGGYTIATTATCTKN